MADELLPVGALTNKKRLADMGDGSVAEVVKLASSGRVVAGGAKVSVSVEKTRPADTNAYGAKDAISESTSAGTVWLFSNMARSAGLGGYIVKARLQTDQTTNTEAFRLHLYNTAPTAINDNAVCTAPLYADAGKYIGTIDFPACKTEGTGATAAYANATTNTTSSGLPLEFITSGDAHLRGILETPAGFTPASGQKITITLDAEQD